MAKPDSEPRGGCCGGGGGRAGVAVVCLGAAVVVVGAALVAGMVLLDTRRGRQVEELRVEVAALQRVVDDLRAVVERQDRLAANTSATMNKSSVRNEGGQEVVYEDEYEYDDEEASYEYDDEDDGTSPSSTVRRSRVISDGSLNSSQPHARTRRNVPVSMIRDESSQTEAEFMRGSHEPEPERVRASESHRPSHRSHHPHSRPPAPIPAPQEQRRVEESFVRLRHGGRNRHSQLSGVELMNSNSPEVFDPPEAPASREHQFLAAHFVGDASQYNTRDHPHYYGNHILTHPHGLFKDWIPADWMSQLGLNSHFNLHEGKLRIDKPGVYFVYAQVYYAATNDRCGFHIKVNGEEVAQCTLTSTGRMPMPKRNTCFTAVVLHLKQSDLLWTSEVEGLRNTSFKNSHSFFGLIMLRAT